jgi:uncharacterized protein (TIGR03790 family)
MSSLQRTTDNGPRTIRHFARNIFLLTIGLISAKAFALSPDELLLVANSNSLEGSLLVRRYCEARGVPLANIVALNLPIGETISFDDYERQVVPQIRTFLRQHQLENKIRCLVTFYGMPIRISGQTVTPELDRERDSIQTALGHIEPKLEPMVVGLESLASSLDPNFQPQLGGSTIQDLSRRANAAGVATMIALNSQTDPEKKRATLSRMMTAYTPLIGLGAFVDLTGVQINFADSAAGHKAKLVVEQYRRARQSMQQLKERPYDLASRQEVRRLMRDYFGLLEYADLLQGQLGYLQTTESGSALDNELPLVMWDYYPRTRWLMNPYRYDAPPAHMPKTFMVMRIDAPTPDLARRLIDDSITTEKTGLHGLMVIDAKSTGGRTNAYAECDLHLAYLAQLVREKTKLPLMYDHNVEVITRPANDHIKNVALYCGWYDPGKYDPAFDFARGSVGFHIASYTMNTLHSLPGNWCVGLMRDGIDATLGPCDEPYLTAFPLADEFFPLLMTGKLQLADVYWKTTPMTSWMISMVGDPLYTPFKVDPALAVEDLPPQLQRAVSQETWQSSR